MAIGDRRRAAASKNHSLSRGRQLGYFDFEDDLALGEWLHGELKTLFGLETERWAIDRVRRVERQLQIYRAPRARMIPEILWMAEPNAFTAPGRYVYITRELLQRAGDDDVVALALAHEMAHHDLGHLDAFRGRRSILRSIPAGAKIALLLRAADRLLIGYDAEADADRYAFELCLRAGYDGERCLEMFDILEAYSLDYGDVDGVFGSDDSLANDVQAVRSWAGRLKEWGYRRMRGYPSIRERKEALLKRLA